MKITLDLLRSLGACNEGIKMFSENFGDESDLITVLKWALNNDVGYEVEYAIWLLLHVIPQSQGTKLSILAAESCIHLFEAANPGDNKPRLALELAKSGYVTEADHEKLVSEMIACLDGLTSLSDSVSAGLASYFAASAVFRGMQGRYMAESQLCTYYVSSTIKYSNIARYGIEDYGDLLKDCLEYGIKLLEEKENG
jgi:hypothetical protein